MIGYERTDIYFRSTQIASIFLHGFMLMRSIKTIGINSNQPVGRGFNYPYDLAILENSGDNPNI